MALILNIDTATETAAISISDRGIVIDSITNTNQKDHASFLQTAIKSLLKKHGFPITKINAVAVTEGPGSYTGIRVGMASAKGLCYALKIPMITINTLEVIALAAIKQTNDENALYCPMIDARRMEVFTAVYDYNLTEIIKPCALILNENSFDNILPTHKVYFSGSGSQKMKEIMKDKNAAFLSEVSYIDSVAELSREKYEKKVFADIFYSSPVYLKELYTYKKAT